MKIRHTFPLAISLLFSSVALAQDSDDSGRAIKYKSRTEIDFDAVDVTGELLSPEGAVSIQRRKASFNPLISLREEFNTEMKNSISEIQ